MARTKEEVASKGDASPRIPKSSAGVTKNTAEAPVKRGRGRPPKGSAPMPKKVYVPTGRPRGRPPGSGKKATAGPKKVAAVNDDGTPKKGRGRPRRAASGAESAATTPKDGKKRGRKPKAAASPAADASDNEETKHTEPADGDDLPADESHAKDEGHDEDGEESD
ncbi:AT hook [Fusarium beomiforme]|uniref:AT hook n=1 Tax=Fusarium beomiforme TaxID=44412 RepID=A0A9P5DX94_9HYPO|nr:AT hook [Fusarium beomiforme]